VRRAGAACGVAVSIGLLAAFCQPAQALVIAPTYTTAINTAPNSADIKSSINTAIGAIEHLYSDPGTINIIFNLTAGGFLGQSQTAYYSGSYSLYTTLLQIDALSHPWNHTLATALAHLSQGNDANGLRPIAATSGLFRVGLNAAGVTPCFNASGTFFGSCNQAYDGIITLSSSQPIQYTRPIPAFNGTNTTFDAVAIIEHEMDEILGGGGAGSTLNSIASFGLNNARSSLTFDDGPLDLYRYSAAHVPSFTTSAAASSYFSIDGGVTRIIGFNQNSTGDFGDFGPNALCPGGGTGGPSNVVQDAFTCRNQMANESTTSPEFQMMTSIGWDPVPEPSTLALLGITLGGAWVARRWSHRRLV